ncbi:glucose-6-phosphate 1-epimerase [Sugiyamaella lignohabitans]|uniref:Glucose-6-phosphate 1-epimerase n=1 Tax=Sugiyamaella lignohabitans TaxID=796027 RepID=A0A167ED28_9ASCO|nr:glucose-6-phosphate 1-epimerase [Sugiyamaella lignohabitans]ANB13922.1 glucose-6-phosphate 1-epimerase [Sugiyamaella lignohabitans]
MASYIKETETEIVLTHPRDSSTSVRILKYGATILSWKVKGQEQLWLSEKAILDGSKAVRGGIPLVFPVFGKSEGHETSQLPQHGFARNSVWEFLGQVESDPLTVQFGLGPENISETARCQWPHDFTLIFTVSLPSEDSLSTSLEVENTDKQPWEFNVLFHTYFRIPDITQTHVEGLTGTQVTDKVSKTNYAGNEAKITIAGEVDRVYSSPSTPDSVAIVSGSKTLFNVQNLQNLKDVVVWNPWTEKANGLADFSPKDGFKNMICVETGSVSKYQTVAPGAKWSASQTLKSHL